MLLSLLACADPTPQPTPGVHIDQVLLGQASTVPMVQDGQVIDTRQTVIVAERDLEVRVTLSTDSDFVRHPVHVNVELLTADDAVVIGAQEEWLLEKEGGWIHLTVPGDLIQADTAIAVSVTEVNPDRRAGAVDDARKPQARFLELDAQEIPAMQVVLVPLSYNGTPPELAPLAEYEAALMAWFPTPEVRLSLHPGAERDQGVRSTADLADEVASLGALRLEEGAIGSVYYGVYGGSSGAGLAGSREFVPELRSAVGPDTSAPGHLKVMGHEIGHLMGAMHTPSCAPDSTDPGYPDPEGGVGVEIWDPITATWLPPETPDLMGYCDEVASSPYTARIFAAGLRMGESL